MNSNFIAFTLNTFKRNLKDNFEIIILYLFCCFCLFINNKYISIGVYALSFLSMIFLVRKNARKKRNQSRPELMALPFSRKELFIYIFSKKLFEISLVLFSIEIMFNSLKDIEVRNSMHFLFHTYSLFLLIIILCSFGGTYLSICHQNKRKFNIQFFFETIRLAATFGVCMGAIAFVITFGYIAGAYLPYIGIPVIVSIPLFIIFKKRDVLFFKEHSYYKTLSFKPLYDIPSILICVLFLSFLGHSYTDSPRKPSENVQNYK